MTDTVTLHMTQRQRSLAGIGCMGVALSHLPYASSLIRQAQEWTELEMLAKALHIERDQLARCFHAFPGNMKEYRRYILATGKLPNA